jgi:hypothetical protein
MEFVFSVVSVPLCLFLFAVVSGILVKPTTPNLVGMYVGYIGLLLDSW